MHSRKIFLSLMAFSVLSSALYVVNQRRVALVLKERHAIEKIYSSPLYVSGALNRFEHDPGTQASLGGDITDFKSKADFRNIEAFSLQGDTATVVVKFHLTDCRINPHTKKRHCYEEIAIQRDTWHKQGGKWFSADSTILSYLQTRNGYE